MSQTDNDIILGGGDTFFVMDDCADGSIVGGKGGTNDDVIDLSGLTGPVTIFYIGDEAGTMTDGTDTVTFSETKRLVLADCNDSVDGSADTAGQYTEVRGSYDSTTYCNDTSTILGGGCNDAIGAEGAGSGDGWTENDEIYSRGRADTVTGGDGDNTNSVFINLSANYEPLS